MSRANIINFLVSWLAITYAFSLGDIVGIGLALAGFLFMFYMCEEIQ